jgi:hypothetical protein
MKINRICLILPKLGIGGTERHSKNLIKMFSSYGVQTDVIYIFCGDNSLSLMNINCLNEGINKGNLNMWKTLTTIRYYLKQKNYDYIYVISKIYISIVLLASFGLNCRFIISERASHTYKWPLKYRVVSWLSRNSKKISLIVSQSLESQIYQKAFYRYAKSSVILPNLYFSEKKVLNESKPSINAFLVISRLNDWSKGLDLLLRLYSYSDRKWPLHIYGGKLNDDKNLKDLIEKLNLGNSVLFYGKIDNLNDLKFKYNFSIIPSRSEGFPNVLLEYLDFEIYPILFRLNSAISSVITTDKDGRIIEKFDYNALIIVLNEIMNNSFYKDDNIYRDKLNNFSPSYYFNKILSSL